VLGNTGSVQAESIEGGQVYQYFLFVFPGLLAYGLLLRSEFSANLTHMSRNRVNRQYDT